MERELDPNGADLLVMSMFNNIQCFTSTHALHSSLSIIVSIILTSITLLIVFIMFESRKSNYNLFAK